MKAYFLSLKSLKQPWRVATIVSIGLVVLTLSFVDALQHVQPAHQHDDDHHHEEL